MLFEILRKNGAEAGFARRAGSITLLRQMRNQVDRCRILPGSVRAAFVLAVLMAFAAPCMLQAAPHKAAASKRAKQLLIYSIDVEGGQSTLLVTPSGDSLLVDTGWPDLVSAMLPK